jgi:cytoskeleton protein RodZ
MPQTIGDTLREARMRQKIDITEIESKTKIRAKYLRAMENEEFDLLPGSTFAKSFLRTYADALGLDAHRLVEEYRAQYEPRVDSDLPPLSSQPSSARRRNARHERRAPGRRFLAIVAGLVVLIVVLLVVGILSPSNNNDKKATASTTTTTTASTTSAKSSGGQTAPATTPTRVALRLVPSVPTYVCVDRGAGTPVLYEGTLDAGKSWRGRHLRLNLGKTSVTLTANGKRVRLKVGPDPAGIDFTPTGHKSIPVGKRPCA